MPPGLLLLPAALLLGGWRYAPLAAVGGVAVWALAAVERPLLWPAAAWLPWLAWAAVSAGFGLQPAAGLEPLSRWASAVAFLALASSWDTRARAAWLKTVVLVTPVLAVAAIATGAGRGFVGHMTGLIPPYYNYTAFALAAGASAAAAWLTCADAPRGRWRAAALAAAISGPAAIFLARSRGALLGLFAAVFLLSARRWGRRTVFVCALGVVMASVLWKSGLVPASLYGVATKRYRPYPELRPQIWTAAVRIADDHPWLGVGPGCFGVAFRRRPIPSQGAARWGFSTDYAHSELLQAAAETGWVGLALWLAAAASALRGVFAPPASAAEAAASAAVVAMSAQLAFDDMLQIPGLAFLFLSAAAVCLPRRPFGRRLPVAAATLGAALALVSLLPRVLARRDPALGAALYPADANRVEDLAYAREAAGRAAQADALWAQASRLAPFDAVYPWRRAQIAAACGNWDRTEAFAAQAVSLEPGFVAARLLRVVAHFHLGRPEQARREADALARELASRPRLDIRSGYESAIWDYDPAELARVRALVGARAR